MTPLASVRSRIHCLNTEIVPGSGGERVEDHRVFNEPNLSRVAPVFSFGLNGCQGFEARMTRSGKEY